jgi:OmpR-family two-component system manganese-sensing sensor histidine kinase
MFQATRRRLAIWYTAVTAVLLLVFASGVYLYVRSTLIERIDDTLNHVVEVVERCLTTSRCASTLVIESINRNLSEFQLNVETSFANNADVVEDDHIDLEWFSPTGELIWSTLSEPLNIPIHLNRMGETVRVVRGSGVVGGWGDKGTRGMGGQGGQGGDKGDKEKFLPCLPPLPCPPIPPPPLLPRCCCGKLRNGWKSDGRC